MLRPAGPPSSSHAQPWHTSPQAPHHHPQHHHSRRQAERREPIPSKPPSTPAPWSVPRRDTGGSRTPTAGPRPCQLLLLRGGAAVMAASVACGCSCGCSLGGCGVPWCAPAGTQVVLVGGVGTPVCCTSSCCRRSTRSGKVGLTPAAAAAVRHDQEGAVNRKCARECGVPWVDM